MPIVEIEQGSPSWLSLRKTKITATDMNVLMGFGHCTPLQLWKRKLDLEEQPKVYMGEKGHEAEGVARFVYEQRFQEVMWPSVYVSDTHEWAMASLDGLSEDRKQALEIKLIGKNDFDWIFSNQKCLPQYYPQVQWQLFVLDLQKMQFMGYIASDAFLIVNVFRDEEYIEKMKKVAWDFYQKLVNFEPPEMTNKDFIERSDDQWRKAKEAWNDLQIAKNNLEIHETALKKVILEMSNGQSATGFGLSASKIVRKGNIEFREIPAIKEMPAEELNKYRKPPTEYWKISIGKE